MTASPLAASVTVVIPVRDRADLLDRCLGALVPQLGPGADVVVIDDGSTDGSGDVARRWARQGAVTVLDGAGRGAVAARSRGIAESTGEIVAFTDSDCVPAPGWLAAGVDAVVGGLDLVQGRTLPVRPCGLLERSIWTTGETGLYDTCNLFVRRAAYEAVGGFDVEAGDRLHFRAGRLRGLGFGEDTLLGWRLRRAGRSHGYVDEAEVRHHVFPFDARDHLRRAWQAGGFAGLVGEVPELRDELLVDRSFLGSRRRVPLYAAGLFALVGRRREAAVAAGVWAAGHGREVLRRERGPRRWAAALAVACADDAVTAVALVVGSARTRSLVL